MLEPYLNGRVWQGSKARSVQCAPGRGAAGETLASGCSAARSPSLRTTTPSQGHLCQKAFLTQSLAPPLPLWQSFRFIYVIKSKQSTLLWSCPGRFHWKKKKKKKLLRKFLSLGQERKIQPNNKPYTYPLSGKPLCFSARRIQVSYPSILLKEGRSPVSYLWWHWFSSQTQRTEWRCRKSSEVLPPGWEQPFALQSLLKTFKSPGTDSGHALLLSWLGLSCGARLPRGGGGMQELGWDRGKDAPSALVFKWHSHILQPDPDMLRGVVKENTEYVTASPCKEWGNEEKRVSGLSDSQARTSLPICFWGGFDPYRKQLWEEGGRRVAPASKFPHQEQPMAEAGQSFAFCVCITHLYHLHLPHPCPLYPFHCTCIQHPGWPRELMAWVRVSQIYPSWWCYLITQISTPKCWWSRETEQLVTWRNTPWPERRGNFCYDDLIKDSPCKEVIKRRRLLLSTPTPLWAAEVGASQVPTPSPHQHSVRHRCCG